MSARAGGIHGVGVLALVVLAALTMRTVAETPPPPDAFSRHCAGCHSLDPDAPPGPGPVLRHVGGRAAASGEFVYSRALRDSALRWNRASLLRFIMDPQQVVPGTSMMLPAVPRAEAEGIADYLMSLSSGGGDRVPGDWGKGAGAVTRSSGEDPDGDSAPPAAWLDGEALVKSEQAAFRVVTVVSGLELPWAMEFLPDGDVLITERQGRVRRVSQGRLDPTPLDGGPHDVYWGGNQAGMHGLAVHPQFERNGFIYLTYSVGSEASSRMRLDRYRLAGRRLIDRMEVFVSEERRGKSHSGGRLEFLADGTLLLSVGSVIGADDEAQNPNSAFGSVLRFNDDGTIPDDNPFVNREGRDPRIFTYGHRNPQGMTLRPGTDQVWTTEHGPMGGDELNRLVPGSNYGWPAITYGRDYDGRETPSHHRASGMRQPAWFWVPSVAPGNLVFYEGERFPHWRGDLFVTALRQMHVQRFEMDGDAVIGRERLLEQIGQRVRDVANGPDGCLYLLTDDHDGRLLRLEPAAGSASADGPGE